jgi:hypothetical protein
LVTIIDMRLVLVSLLISPPLCLIIEARPHR